jgi:hypothetical protein
MELTVLILGPVILIIVLRYLTSQNNEIWTQLYELYPGDSIDLKPTKFQRVKIGELYVNGCVAIGVNDEGVLIKSSLSRTTMKQPIYIPHRDIKFTSWTTPTIPPMQAIRTTKAPSIDIALDKKWTNKIKKFQPVE